MGGEHSGRKDHKHNLSLELTEAKSSHKAPDYLTGEALAFWNRNVKHVDLDERDRDTFAMTCELYQAVRTTNKNEKNYNGLVMKFRDFAREFDLFPGVRKQRRISELGVSHALPKETSEEFDY